jgi:hypothetical protein
MAIFQQVVAAPAAYTAPDVPSVVIPFIPKRIVIVNQDAAIANAVQVSFDGATDALNLVPTINPREQLHQRVTRLWVKRSAGTPSVLFVAEDVTGE